MEPVCGVCKTTALGGLARGSLVFPDRLNDSSVEPSLHVPSAADYRKSAWAAKKGGIFQAQQKWVVTS